MTSHDYAKKIRKLAEFLEAKPEFKLPSYSASHYEKRGIEDFIHPAVTSP